jgi:hypothetical protein
MNTAAIAGALEEAAKQVASLKEMEGAQQIVRAHADAASQATTHHRDAMAQREKHHAALVQLLTSNQKETMAAMAGLVLTLKTCTRATDMLRVTSMLESLKVRGINYADEEKKLQFIRLANQLGCAIPIPDKHNCNYNYHTELTNTTQQAFVAVEKLAATLS